ncbi:MAG TPA: AIPR family protein [Panacibacter sp.]|nr:AIPR family protein [Panacibacter sp.]
MTKYESLVRILDQIRKEAPTSYKRYYPLDDEKDKLDQARARAYIHLFIKVKFGILDFTERENLITDETDDGGIDGYYIDTDNKVIYFIQSKFRISEKYFEEKEITLSEILAMDVDRIVNGEIIYENGNPYNHKIKQLIKKIQDIPDPGRYKHMVIILANLKKLTTSQLRQLSGGFPCYVYDNEKAYSELVFPLISGTYYNAKELKITINLSDKGSTAEISYSVNTSLKDCLITVLFVPTEEIAKTLFKYKNSILKYNPRSYLDLVTGSVNSAIASSITDKQTNEFALFNNGITMLSDGTDFNKQIARKDTAQLIVTNPQIINGGQTAFTLSVLYEKLLNQEISNDIFKGKEVLLKVITFSEVDENDEHLKLQLIEEISKATNQQTPVTDADRRSNDKIQIDIQKKIFVEFGLFYQRKNGEFGDGVKNKYIDRSQIIDRSLFLRLCLACDMQPSQARSKSEESIFKKGAFENILNNSSRYKEYVFAYYCFVALNVIHKDFTDYKNNPDGVLNYGYALRNGRFAVVSASMKYIDVDKIDSADFERLSFELINQLLKKWLSFEKWIINLPLNKKYFREEIDEESKEITRYLNFDGYYKGTTINIDIKTFNFNSDKSFDLISLMRLLNPVRTRI